MQSIIEELYYGNVLPFERRTPRSGVRFTKENIVFITKDGTGQTVWLEKGNALAGLQHILDGDGRSPGHTADFERVFGVSREDIPVYLQKVVTDGVVVSNELKKKRISRRI